MPGSVRLVTAYYNVARLRPPRRGVLPPLARTAPQFLTEPLSPDKPAGRFFVGARNCTLPPAPKAATMANRRFPWTH